MNALNVIAEQLVEFAEANGLTYDKALSMLSSDIREREDKYLSDRAELGQQARRCMRNNFNRDLRLLAAMPRTVVAAIDGVGKKAMEEFDVALEAVGLTWATTLPFTSDDPMEVIVANGYSLDLYRADGIVTVGDLVNHPKFGERKRFAAIKKLL